MKLGAQKALLKKTGWESDVDDRVLQFEREWEKAFATTTSRSHPSKNTIILGTRKTKRHSLFSDGSMRKRRRVGELGKLITKSKIEKVRATNRHKCCMVGCSNNFTKSVSIRTMRYKRVPPFKPKLTKEEAMSKSKQSQITAWRKYMTRRKILDRLGLSMSCEEQELRYCENHEVEQWVLQGYKIPVYNSDGSLTYVSKTFKAIDIPKPVGKLSVMNTSIGSSKKNKGLSYDRAAIRILDGIDVTSDTLAHQQAWEMQDVSQKKHRLADINPTVQEKAGLDVHEEDVMVNNNLKRKRTNDKVKVEQNVRYMMSDCTPKKINALTGSIDLPGLLEEIIVICGGDFNLITETQSYMTWLEEWLFFFSYSSMDVNTCDGRIFVRLGMVGRRRSAQFLAQS